MELEAEISSHGFTRPNNDRNSSARALIVATNVATGGRKPREGFKFPAAVSE